jgi:hypothetical protein
MATATGVAKVIQFARDGNVPFFGVYVDGAGAYSTLPASLARDRMIPWTWTGVANAIGHLITEGKNAK